MVEKEFLRLEDIVAPESTRDVYVEALGKWIKIRFATVKDRLEAYSLASRHPSWNQMNMMERDFEVLKMVALKILVEPQISYEDYVRSDDAKINRLLGAVVEAYYGILSGIKGELRSFLGDQKESSQKSSSVF
jgi:hypothetical protein